MLKVRY